MGSTSQVAEIVEIVDLVEAKSRIPDEYRDFTFFGHGDFWVYHAVLDDRTCERCQDYAEGDLLNGSFIRGAFPYLEIQDEDTIQVNAHPNCRCWLERA